MLFLPVMQVLLFFSWQSIYACLCSVTLHNLIFFRFALVYSNSDNVYSVTDAAGLLSGFAFM
jgi:hypothetical protein